MTKALWWIRRDYLERLLSETGADAIYAQEDVSPYARQRDTRIAENLPLRLVPGLTVHPLTAVLKADGDPAANNGGWQWTAGTGTDAAPYDQVK